MVKKINALLSGLPMTIVAGLFLLVDLVPHLMEELGAGEVHLSFLPFDPAWVTVVISGTPLLYLAIWRLIYNPGIRKISSALLICIAMFAAIAIDDLFAAGEVAFIMAIGALLEEATTNRAKKGLKKLIQLAPATGRVLRDGKAVEIPAEQIQAGEILRILPGEKIPVDGEILTGQTSVDQAILTGESLPVDKGPGDPVFCGTGNCFGSVDIRATNVGQDTSLQTLIRMVRQAEEKQAPMQRIADQAASWLVPVALAIAAGAYLFTGNLVTAVTVLVVFCPCALVLATPTAIMAAIGQATKHGVIIKSGEALEKMGRVNTIAFDKTGTLTRGQLTVSDILPLEDGLEQAELLRLTAAAEVKSEHPLGKAVVAFAGAENLPECQDFRMEAGKGVRAVVAGKDLLCGSQGYLAQHGVAMTRQAEALLEGLRSQGKASILVAEGGRLLGILGLSDVLRPEAREVVQKLARMGAQTVLLTGDHRQAADFFASQAGISQVRSQLLPEEKVSSIQAMQQAGQVVCMIGDGVNDAPALKTADVSVAMGCMGSDIAVESAEVALMQEDLSMLPYLKRLANATVKTIRFSIALSMGINFVAIGLSLAQLLSPTTGALVHNAGSCLVVLIAALLYDRKFQI